MLSDNGFPVKTKRPVSLGDSADRGGILVVGRNVLEPNSDTSCHQPSPDWSWMIGCNDRAKLRLALHQTAEV